MLTSLWRPGRLWACYPSTVSYGTVITGPTGHLASLWTFSCPRQRTVSSFSSPYFSSILSTLSFLPLPSSFPPSWCGCDWGRWTDQVKGFLFQSVHDQVHSWWVSYYHFQGTGPILVRLGWHWNQNQLCVSSLPFFVCASQNPYPWATALQPLVHSWTLRETHS